MKFSTSLAVAAISFTCLLSSSILLANTAERDPDQQAAKIERLVEISGLNDTFDVFSAGLQQGVKREISGLRSDDMDERADEFFSWIIGRANSVFTSDALRHEVVARMHETLTEADVKELTDWFDSELGSRINEIEKNSGEADPAEKAEFFQALGANPTSRVRMDFYQRIIALSGMERLLNLIMGGASKSLILGMSSKVDMELGHELESLSQEQDHKLAIQQNQIKQYVSVIVQYTYRNLTLDELNSYVQVLEKNSSKRLSIAIVEGLGGSITGGGFELGASMGEYLTAQLQD